MLEANLHRQREANPLTNLVTLWDCQWVIVYIAILAT